MESDVDIVERLRATHERRDALDPNILGQAADEIERLREALADLIADLMKEPEVARDVIKALKGKSWPTTT